MDFYDVLQKCGDNAGVSMRQISLGLGHAEGYVANMKSGTRVPGVNTAAKLLGACGYRLAAIRVDGKGNDIQVIGEGVELVEVSQDEYDMLMDAVFAQSASKQTADADGTEKTVEALEGIDRLLDRLIDDAMSGGRGVTAPELRALQVVVRNAMGNAVQRETVGRL